MASLSYLTFLHGARAQLQLLSRGTHNFKSCTAVNNKHSFYRQSLYKSVLANDCDCDNVRRKYTGTANYKDSQIKDKPITDDRNIDSTDTKINETSNESHNFHTSVKADSCNTKNSSVGQSSLGSKKINDKTVSKYFKQSWLNYYSSVTKNAENMETKNHLQTESPLKEKRAKTFGNFSMEASNRSEKLDERHPNERMDDQIPEDTDEQRDPRLDVPLTRNGRINKTSFYYTRKISILGRQGKIKEAIAIYEDWMMVRDRVMPTKRTFVALIGILGRVGYTKKAFELFSRMKQFGLDPEDHIYTSLFNACANSPSHAEGLRRTEYLLNYMKTRGILPNLFTIKAAMKALAISGDFSRVFTLMDEASTRLRLDTECFSHLLIACISDKEAGFRRALQVWQRMGLYRVRPDINTFNLLIRSTRDCGIGDPRTFDSVFGLDSLDSGRTADLLESVKHSFGQRLDKRKFLPLQNPVLLTESRRPSDHMLEVTGTKMTIHSSFSPEQQDSGLCSAVVTKNVSEQSVTRGITSEGQTNEQTGPLNSQSSRNISVGIKADQTTGDTTIVHECWPQKSADCSNSQVSGLTKCEDHSQSLYSDLLTEDTSSIVHQANKMSLKDLKIPSGRLALLGGARKFISFMEEVRTQPDVRTLTQILACLPNNEQSEFELLTLMEERGIMPDIDFLNDIMMRRNARKRGDTVKAVLKVMSKLRLTPNMRTYAALALTCYKNKDAYEFLQDMKENNLEPNSVIMGSLIYIAQGNYSYKLQMLKEMETLGLKATHKTIATIENSIAITKQKIIEAEKKKDVNNYLLSEPFQRSFQYFLRYYKNWLMRTEVDRPRHPWDAFQSSPEHKQQKAKTSATVS